MNNRLEKVKYFPIIEVLLLIVTVILTFSVALNKGTQIWIPIALTIFFYFTFLGRANIINLTKDKIAIQYMNLFQGHVEIELSAVTKIWTTQTFNQEIDATVESSFNVFRRRYYLEYHDKKGKARQASFTINSNRKEAEIIKLLNTSIQVKN